MVRPEMVAVTPEGTSRTSTALLPLTAKAFAPGPRMVTLVLRSIVLWSVMVAHGGDRAKVMVSPGLTLDTAWRSEPVPESAQLVTVIVAAPATCAGRSATVVALRAVS